MKPDCHPPSSHFTGTSTPHMSLQLSVQPHHTEPGPCGNNYIIAPAVEGEKADYSNVVGNNEGKRAVHIIIGVLIRNTSAGRTSSHRRC